MAASRDGPFGVFLQRPRRYFQDINVGQGQKGDPADDGPRLVLAGTEGVGASFGHPAHIRMRIPHSPRAILVMKRAPPVADGAVKDGRRLEARPGWRKLCAQRPADIFQRGKGGGTFGRALGTGGEVLPDLAVKGLQFAGGKVRKGGLCENFCHCRLLFASRPRTSGPFLRPHSHNHGQGKVRHGWRPKDGKEKRGQWKKGAAHAPSVTVRWRTRRTSRQVRKDRAVVSRTYDGKSRLVAVKMSGRALFVKSAQARAHTAFGRYSVYRQLN